MPPPAVSSTARDAFIALVRAANLFAPIPLTRVEAAVPLDAATPADAARALVAAKHLTKFQAERLLAGKTDGFHLGPYVILEQVGRGSVGRVFKARHRTMNRPVAVKVLSADLTRTTEARATFQAEVRSAGQLNHPNIVTAYDANEVGDRFYLVLEFVDGPNLETLVRERGPLPASEACELARQAALGLDHAHTRGMLHRDIKPGNLLVARPSKTTPDFLVKISDFGLAKLAPATLLAQTPAPGATHGTADYGAPEQAGRSRATDHRADIYSLGAVVYFLLTGRPPFPGGTAEDKARRHLYEEPERLEHLRPDVPPVLAALVHQMLAKHPLQRPPSADELVGRFTAIGAAFGDAVSFDLPAPQSGAYSFVGGQLSGGMSDSYPMAEVAFPDSGAYPQPHSGAYPQPHSGVYPQPRPHSAPYPGAVAGSVPTAAPVADPSPWGRLEAEGDAESAPTGVSVRSVRRNQGLSYTTLSVLAACAAVMCFAGSALFKVLAK